MSNILEQSGREFLNPKITIVPCGGLEKVPMFVSLLRGSKLNIACLLDSHSIPKGGDQKLKNLVSEKLIKEKNIRFFDEFSRNIGDRADIEDVFSKNDYLKMFNKSFKGKIAEIKYSDLNSSIKPILLQIYKHLNVEHFNHFTPANALAKEGADLSYFEDETLDNFEAIFKAINSIF